MRHNCSGEDVCGMVKRDERGNVSSVSEAMNTCANNIGGETKIHCGLIRTSVYFERGSGVKKREAREETLYQSRMLPFFKEETKLEFAARMRRAASGAWEGGKPGMRAL